MPLFPRTWLTANARNVAAVVPVSDRFWPKARRETALLKHNLCAIQSELNLVFDNPVALRNARGGASFRTTKGVNGRVQLFAVVNIDVVEVSSAAELVESRVGFVRALGPDWEGVAIPRASRLHGQRTPLHQR